MDGNDGSGGGPVIANDEIGYSWTTYPERLQAAGISWKIYQDVGAGLDAAHFWGWGPDPYIGNFGDNSLLYFSQYQNAAPGSPLYDGARTGTDVKNGGTYFDILAADVKNGSCRTCRGSSRRRRSQSIRLGRRATAPGTRRAC